MADITVTLADGNTAVVSADAIALPEGAGFYGADFGDPEGYQRADTFNANVDRRVQSIVSKRDKYVPAEETTSDEFFATLAKRRGIQLDDNLKPVAQIDPEKLSSFKATWAKDELEPLRTEAEALRKQNTSLLRENVTSRTQATLLGELKDDAFKPALPGTPSPFDALLQHFVQFDDEGKAYFQAGADAMPEYEIDKAVLAYVKKHNPDLLADKRQRGGGLDGDPGGGGGKQMNRTQFDALSPDAQMKFIQAGGKVVEG